MKISNCFWCGRTLVQRVRGQQENLTATRDHYPARVNRKDFPDLPELVVRACFECNNLRGNDDRWIPFALRTPEQQEKILAGGTQAVLEMQKALLDKPVVQRESLYYFIALLEEDDPGWFGSDASEEDFG